MLFEEVPAAQNPEAVLYKKVTKDLWLENSKLPEFKIGQKREFSESVFSQIITRPNAMDKKLDIPKRMTDMSVLRVFGKLPDIPILSAPSKPMEKPKP